MQKVLFRVLVIFLTFLVSVAMAEVKAEIEVINKTPTALRITCLNETGKERIKPISIDSHDKKTITCGLEKRNPKLAYGLLHMNYKEGEHWVTLSPKKESKTCKISVDYIEYYPGKMKLTVYHLTRDDNADVSCWVSH